MFASLVISLVSVPAIGQNPVHLEVIGDAIPRSLTTEPGDAARGRSVVVNRDAGACTLCHAVPGEKNFGNIAPTLAGAGARLSIAQLRLRVADSTRVNPKSPMPAYYRTEGLSQVAAAFRGKPVLSAQQVEDVVAWLATLKEPE
ncbi:MAG TPA: sulfur oxidation c-type cytochrome SoxX [Burkholderiales bacterium]|nr:sulfur oxidation c-type cytochrome SoxX [Burkholderiales bacterium]